MDHNYKFDFINRFLKTVESVCTEMCRLVEIGESEVMTFFTLIVQHSIYLEPYDEAVAYLDLIETDGDIKINIHSWLL